MQSLSEKIVGSILCAVFHSPLVNNAEFSNSAGKKAKKYKSHYKSSKEFDYTIHRLNGVNYEILEPMQKRDDVFSRSISCLILKEL